MSLDVGGETLTSITLFPHNLCRLVYLIEWDMLFPSISQTSKNPELLLPLMKPVWFPILTLSHCLKPTVSH